MIPLYTSSQIRNADRYAVEQLKLSGVVLMENASRNIFLNVKQFVENFDGSVSIGIVCGRGNNGGDGFAAARHFLNNGNDVNIIALAEKSEYKGDALFNYTVTENLLKKLNKKPIKTFSGISDLSAIKNSDLIIDAILGTGARGELKEPIKSIVKKLNTFEGIKIAVDIPTGLDADLGAGTTIFNADLTITLAELKRGLFFGAGYSNSGLIVKGGIGIGNEYFDEQEVEDYLIEKKDARLFLPEKAPDLHKYSAGKVLTIAGSADFPGAAALTAQSALYSGAGASILAVPDWIKQVLQTKLESAVVLAYDDEGSGFLSEKNINELQPKIEWADVVAIGPGLSRNETTLKAVRKIIEKYSEKIFVIDADAVLAFAGMNLKKFNFSNMVFTPHHKEFAALIGIDLFEIENDLLLYGKNFAVLNKTTLVLKGAPTIIFDRDGNSFINSAGNQGMAKFGTGDVLTGVLAAFIAQNNSLIESVIAGVYLHSYSADLLLNSIGMTGITSEAILKNLPFALKKLEDEVV